MDDAAFFPSHQYQKILCDLPDHRRENLKNFTLYVIMSVEQQYIVVVVEMTDV